MSPDNKFHGEKQIMKNYKILINIETYKKAVSYMVPGG